ncbi:MAG: hypothetical protein ACJAXT_000682 [Paracoccaceae bacterium]|jgi:hypothetical protein
MTQDPLLIVIILAVIIVLVILFFGIGSFGRGGDYNHKNANKFMRWRLYAQFVAIILIVVFVYFRKSTGG